MSELMDSIWVEKYRPKKLDDLALPEQYTLDFKRMIAKCEMPNLLFSGPPGGGKCVDGNEIIEVYIEVDDK